MDEEISKVVDDFGFAIEREKPTNRDTRKGKRGRREDEQQDRGREGAQELEEARRQGEAQEEVSTTNSATPSPHIPTPHRCTHRSSSFCSWSSAKRMGKTLMRRKRSWEESAASCKSAVLNSRKRVRFVSIVSWSCCPRSVVSADSDCES